MKKKFGNLFLLIILGITMACILPRAFVTTPANLGSTSLNCGCTTRLGGSGGAGIPPTINITYPNNGQTVMSEVNITAKGSCSVGVNNVELMIDGVFMKNTTATSLTSIINAWYMWNTTTCANGNHNITAIVMDSIARKANVTITVNVQNGGSSLGQAVGTAVAIVGVIGAGSVGVAILNRNLALKGKKAGGKSRGSPGQDKEFNPQPEPPGKPGNYAEINPQPEPPGMPDASARGFNPQPEPPGKGQHAIKKKKIMK